MSNCFPKSIYVRMVLMTSLAPQIHSSLPPCPPAVPPLFPSFLPTFFCDPCAGHAKHTNSITKIFLGLIHVSPGERKLLGKEHSQSSLLAYRMGCGKHAPLENRQEFMNPGNSVTTGDTETGQWLQNSNHSVCSPWNNKLSSLTKPPTYSIRAAAAPWMVPPLSIRHVMFGVILRSCWNYLLSLVGSCVFLIFFFLFNESGLTELNKPQESLLSLFM